MTYEPRGQRSPAARGTTAGKALCWVLAAYLFLIPAVMLLGIYRLGPRGTCEDDLNNGAMLLVWLAGTAIGGLVAYALVRLADRPIGLREPGISKLVAGFLLAVDLAVAGGLLIFAAWAIATDVRNANAGVSAAVLSLPFLLAARRRGRQTALSAALGAAAVIFVLGLIPMLTHTTCVE